MIIKKSQRKIMDINEEIEMLRKMNGNMMTIPFPAPE